MVQVIKSRRMGWAGYVARMVEGRGVYMVWVGKPEGKRLLGRSRCRWGTIVRWIFKKYGLGLWIGFSWPGIEIGGGHL
jgi:hypothetical protein